jgi:Flp pilus assembly secretin CpaC
MRSNRWVFIVALTCIVTLVASKARAQRTADTENPIHEQSDAVLVFPAYSRPKPRTSDHAVEEETLKVADLLDQIRSLRAEIAQLHTGTAAETTVTVHVKIMELQSSKMRRLGFDFQTADGLSLERLAGKTLVQLGEFNGLIQALQQQCLVKMLAESTLITVSGRPATFQSGGEFPVVVPQSQGNQAVEYRQFGTRLDCLAEILDSGRIRLELRSSVSELDSSRSVMIQATSVPGLHTRSIDTAVEMKAGETLVLSGLRQARPGDTADSAEIEEIALLVSVTADLGEPVKQAEKKDASKCR